MKKVFLFTVFSITLFAKGFPSWFYDIKDTQVKKETFIEILKPIIEFENSQVSKEREFLKAFFSNDFLMNFHKKVTPFAKDRLVKIAKKYGVKKLFNKKEFFKRVDSVPTSLAIAQAAIESAWGSSRFTKVANNIFGHWTFKGDGITPKNRDEGKKHQIRVFSSLQDSISAYLLNLNTHFAYENFRKLRYKFKSKKKKFDGLVASKTLHRYSEKGEEYIKLLRRVIKKNNLLIYDKEIV